MAGGAIEVSLAGHLTGSIDLVLRVPGGPADTRFVVADYKTNALHPRGVPVGPADYGPDRLLAAMDSTTTRCRPSSTRWPSTATFVGGSPTTDRRSTWAASPTCSSGGWRAQRCRRGSPRRLRVGGPSRAGGRTERPIGRPTCCGPAGMTLLSVSGPWSVRSWFRPGWRHWPPSSRPGCSGPTRSSSPPPCSACSPASAPTSCWRWRSRPGPRGSATCARHSTPWRYGSLNSTARRWTTICRGRRRTPGRRAWSSRAWCRWCRGPGRGGASAAWDGGRLYLHRYWHYELAIADDLTRRGAAAPSGWWPAPVGTWSSGCSDRCSAPGLRVRPPAAGGPTCARSRVCQSSPVGRARERPTRWRGCWPPPIWWRPSSGRHLSVALAAPTGKAAARMGEAVQAAVAGLVVGDRAAGVATLVAETTPTTIHSLLGWKDRTHFRHDAGPPVARGHGDHRRDLHGVTPADGQAARRRPTRSFVQKSRIVSPVWLTLRARV